MSARRLAPVPCVLSAAVLAAALFAAPAAAADVKGAAILDHPCGKTAVKHMGLVHAGKMDEAQKLGSKAMQEEWSKLPAEDRKMMSEMMKAMAKSEAEFSADIKAHGLLQVEGKSATLTVSKEIKEGGGSGTETMTQSYEFDGKSCLITP
jgi:hypothetical protein